MLRTNSHAGQPGRRVTFLRSLAILAAALGVAAVSACNTTEGLGRDVKSAGRGIEKAAQDNK